MDASDITGDLQQRWYLVILLSLLSLLHDACWAQISQVTVLNGSYLWY